MKALVIQGFFCCLRLIFIFYAYIYFLNLEGKVKMWKKFTTLFQREKSFFDNWFMIDERIRFVMVGFGNTLIRYAIFVILGVITSISHYQIILLASWLLSSVTAFFAYKILVFETSGNHWKEYGRSLIVWTLSYFINALFLEILIKNLMLNPYLAQAIAILFIMVINYLLFKHFAFKIERKNFIEKLFGFFEN